MRLQCGYNQPEPRPGAIEVALATLYPHLETIEQTESEIICLKGTQIPVYWIVEEYHRLHQSVDAVICYLLSIS